MQHTGSMWIAKPPSEVWALVGDPESWPRWARELSDVHVEGELRKGTTLSYRYRGGRVTVTVVEYVPGRQLTVRSSQKSYEFQESIALVGAGESTEVSITMEFEPSAWWARVLAPLLAPFSGLLLGKGLKRSLLSLRRAAEGGSPPAL